MESTRKKRPFLPKVKSGCRTCKIRKVKCDEAKPQCRRCNSTGRPCGGYGRNNSPSSTITLVSAKTSPGSGEVYYGMDAWLESEVERRSFDFFLNHASSRLGGFFQSPFWSREVLQAAIHHPSIRHLVVALGAAYEQFEDRVSQSSEDREEMRFALHQCNQGIRHLTQKSGSLDRSEQSIENTSSAVIASILFTVFASLQGHMGEAMDHVRSGLRVLQDLQDLQASKEKGPTFALSSAYPVPLARMRSLLTNLYAQMRSMVNDEAIIERDSDPLLSNVNCPSSFVSLADAQDHIQALFSNTIAFFQKNSFEPPQTQEIRDKVRVQQDVLRGALSDSRSALKALILREAGSDDGSIEAATTVVRLYHTYLKVRLGLDVLRDDEFMFDSFESDFEEMLMYCEKIFEVTPYNEPTCSSGLGVVMPLHMIAARCRNPTIRRKAVALLLSGVRREGVWDSIRVGRVVAMTVELEEKQEVLQHGRVREVKIITRDDHGAWLAFICGGGSGNDQQEYRRYIEW